MTLHDTLPRVYVHVGCSHDGYLFAFDLLSAQTCIICKRRCLIGHVVCCSVVVTAQQTTNCTNMLEYAGFVYTCVFANVTSCVLDDALHIMHSTPLYVLAL